MKIKLTIILIFISTLFTNAQIYTPDGTVQGPSNNNYVGVGTPPEHLLHLHGSHGDSRILLHSYGGGSDATQADLMLWASEPGLTYAGVGIGNNIHNFNNVNGGLRLLNPARGGSYIRLLDAAMSFNIVTSGGLDTQVLAINTSGNIGIGTSSPNAKLDISDFTPGLGTAIMLAIGERGFNSSSYGFRFKTDNLTGLLSIFGVNAEVETTSLFSISRITGNIGIGTINPTSKLTVAGNIASREVKVTVDAGADFVFENDYNLPSLESVDQFIKENKHLPEIASAKQMQKDGINLSEMNIKLLQKIEEMTLYMIEIKKEIELLKKMKN
ncbi:hypothetical protein [Flavobacterium sp. C3NV]|uniref:hypothetical protein n=1 Tax=Flavobacterium sp. C3NV TaxID=3393358 RepID=UPI00399013B4